MSGNKFKFDEQAVGLFETRSRALVGYQYDPDTAAGQTLLEVAADQTAMLLDATIGKAIIAVADQETEALDDNPQIELLRGLVESGVIAGDKAAAAISETIGDNQQQRLGQIAEAVAAELSKHGLKQGPEASAEQPNEQVYVSRDGSAIVAAYYRN